LTAKPSEIVHALTRGSVLHPLRDTTKLLNDLVSIGEDDARRWDGIPEDSEISAGESRNGRRIPDGLDASG
jgi:hypothetical protein